MIASLARRNEQTDDCGCEDHIGQAYQSTPAKLQHFPGEGWQAGFAASLANSSLTPLDRASYRHGIPNETYHFPPNYRGGQLVVEYATVGFRSQEDFGPIV